MVQKYYKANGKMFAYFSVNADIHTNLKANPICSIFYCNPKIVTSYIKVINFFKCVFSYTCIYVII